MQSYARLFLSVFIALLVQRFLSILMLVFQPFDKKLTVNITISSAQCHRSFKNNYEWVSYEKYLH